jgi:hypothetical protein
MEFVDRIEESERLTKVTICEESYHSGEILSKTSAFRRHKRYTIAERYNASFHIYFLNVILNLFRAILNYISKRVKIEIFRQFRHE